MKVTIKRMVGDDDDKGDDGGDDGDSEATVKMMKMMTGTLMRMVPMTRVMRQRRWQARD